MTDAPDILARCTRDGVVLWGQVAKQMGISVDRARKLYDPVSSSRSDPQQLAEDREPLSAGMGRGRKCAEGEGLKAQILIFLERHRRLTVEDLAKRAQSTPNSIRRRLADLLRCKLVQHDNAGDKIERTWTLTLPGQLIARSYSSRPGDIGPGAPTAIGQKAA